MISPISRRAAGETVIALERPTAPGRPASLSFARRRDGAHPRHPLASRRLTSPRSTSSPRCRRGWPTRACCQSRTLRRRAVRRRLAVRDARVPLPAHVQAAGGDVPGDGQGVHDAAARRRRVRGAPLVRLPQVLLRDRPVEAGRLQRRLRKCCYWSWGYWECKGSTRWRTIGWRRLQNPSLDKFKTRSAHP